MMDYHSREIEPGIFLHEAMLENQLPVMVMPLPGSRSVSAGIWFNVGSRDEKPDQNGMAHMLEHMVFRGGNGLTGKEITLKLESLGAHANAYVEKETTYYYVQSLPGTLKECMKLLADVIVSPTISNEDLLKERHIVVDEIASVDDNPNEYLEERFDELLWPGHPLGFPITGVKTIINHFNITEIRRFHAQGYIAKNAVVVIAGQIEVEDGFDAAMVFSNLATDTRIPTIHFPLTQAMETKSTFWKNLEQSQIIMGKQVTGYLHPQKYILSVLATILGGGASSRLFQKLREEEGLVYGISADVEFYRDTGQFGIWMASNPEDYLHAVEIIWKEVDLFLTSPPTDQEILTAKRLLLNGILTSLEGPSGWLNRLAATKMRYGKYIHVDETIANLNSVTREQVVEASRWLLSSTGWTIAELRSKK